ncbi:MAG TPA: methyltransferase domain-containing protein [Arenimonas sp.]|nr:methyltransferase domain-containing protein [Arenimonas sp.]
MSEGLESDREAAYRSFAEGDLPQALARLRAIYDEHGANAQSANDLAVVLFRSGQHRQAIEKFREAQRLSGDEGNLLVDNLLDAIESLLAASDGQHQRRLRHHGTFCPVCGRRDAGFRPLPAANRAAAERHGYAHFGKGEMTAHETYTCAACGASDRERLYAYWLRQRLESGRIVPGSRILHFAPEPALSRQLASVSDWQYETADLSMPGVDHRVDITRLPFADASYDLLICSHVLEHVPDDRQAMRELARILKPGGVGILMAPIIVGLAHSVEDPAVTDAAERWRLFGQGDHVRLYARDDFVRRLEESGFRVERLATDAFDAGAFAEMGLKPSSALYLGWR